MQLTVLLIQMQIDQGHGQYATWQYAERVAKIIAKTELLNVISVVNKNSKDVQISKTLEAVQDKESSVQF